jgi:glycosyltransferase involved in cell wall biosynthesis
MDQERKPRTLSIVIPVYNEDGTVYEALRRVAVQDTGGWEKEIIVVDDGSRDSSKLKVQSAKLQFKIKNLLLLEHGKNLGKGAAIRTALTRVTGDYILIQDADLEYDPADWPILLEAAEANPGAAVYGSRNLKPDRRGYRHFVWGVWFLTALINLLFRARLTDAYTGYKLIPRRARGSFPLISRGFEFEAEVTARLLKRKIMVQEVPIHYYPRKFSEGKKIRWQDGLKGFWTIVKNRVMKE